MTSQNTHAPFLFSAARLSRRVFGMRLSGTALGAVAVAGVFHDTGATGTVWIALALTTLLWPPIAFLMTLRATNPERAESVNLIVDSIIAGVWIAVIQFNPLPAVVLAVLVTTDEFYVGIPGLWRKSVAALLVSAFAAGALNGFAFDPHTSQLVVMACLPAMILQPMLVGFVTGRMIVRVRSQNRQLDQLSRTDALTGLGTRRFWQERARHDLVAYRRSGRPLSLMMVDIDYFKAVNDRHGHAVGDQILCMVGDVISRHCRGSDYAARLGGDEFCIVLGDTDQDQAYEVAERISLKITERAQLTRVPMRCTVSIGIAQAGVRHDDLEQWMSHADEALYRAKSLGRNRIMPPRDHGEPESAEIDVPRQIALIR